MTSRPDGRARIRGVFVGATSGTLSIAAHGVGGGTMMPSESALVLLVIVSAAVGGVVAVLAGRVPMVAVLALGQVCGHTVLTIASEHHHGTSLTPSMLAAHAVATMVCALLIRAAVLGHGHALSVLRRILPVLCVVLPVEDERPRDRTEYRPDVVLRLLACSGVGTRGPPVAA
ncbi:MULTISPECIES: hypothetical protein [unclassified Rhodococcus (in: high G+C Gram-positive bacteria)]|uniref:hypothetical protein n=1 Tax=unclassified Rhodococcus (in: high G+C Gram-positive bacteria) TaxID=192944 RepID=UPI0016B82C59|nr:MULTISPECIES: hypothetical protein [unclassified Rhodococcus (in: high G+C Gram-positive bacteria)]NIL77503.1 hypothetical protein [Rhodococcus sp. B10]